MKDKMIYGLDIGGTKIEIAIFDQQMLQLDSWRVPTPTGCYQSFLDTINQMVVKADTLYQCKGLVGIGMPGLISQDGSCLAANISCANGQFIQRDLQLALNRPVTLENDCRCFALSEANDGAGENFTRVFGAVLGTGAAGGLCIDRELVQSTHKIIGEFGHIPLPAFFSRKYSLPDACCECGLQDCMESYIAGPGLVRLYQHQLQSLHPVTAPDCIKALRAGKIQAQQAFDCYMDLLGYTFASLVQHYDPDVIVLGGGMSKTDEILESLPKAIARYVFKTVTVPPVVRARYGDSSGVRGAAIFGSQELV